jgi:hypothetical protein
MSIIKLLRYNSTILGCRGEIEECTQWLEQSHDQLSGASDDAIDALAESALLLADEARHLAAIARKRGHRADLSTVTEED